VAEDMMVDERLVEFTGRRLAQYHREIGQQRPALDDC